jgi:hypothetical protein
MIEVYWPTGAILPAHAEPLDLTQSDESLIELAARGPVWTGMRHARGSAAQAGKHGCESMDVIVGLSPAIAALTEGRGYHRQMAVTGKIRWPLRWKVIDRQRIQQEIVLHPALGSKMS